MADRLLLESSSVDGYLLEDGSGVLLNEVDASAASNPEPLHAVIREAIHRSFRW